MIAGLLGHVSAFAHSAVERQEESLRIHNPAGEHSEPSQAREITLVIREGAYHLFQKNQTPVHSVLMIAGEDVRLSLRNEDSIAHEMISPLFMRADIRIQGKGIGLFRNEAGGFRLRPGDHLSTQFTVPSFAFETFYDLIWCARHGKGAGTGNEILVVQTQSPGSRR